MCKAGRTRQLLQQKQAASLGSCRSLPEQQYSQVPYQSIYLREVQFTSSLSKRNIKKKLSDDCWTWHSRSTSLPSKLHFDRRNMFVKVWYCVWKGRFKSWRCRYGCNSEGYLYGVGPVARPAWQTLMAFKLVPSQAKLTICGMQARKPAAKDEDETMAEVRFAVHHLAS